MKYYDKLKAEMEAMQQMLEAKKNDCTNTLKKVKRFCKEFSRTADMQKSLLAEKLNYFIA